VTGWDEQIAAVEVRAAMTSLAPPYGLHTASIQPTKGTSCCSIEMPLDLWLYVAFVAGLLTHRGARGAARPPWPRDCIGFLPHSPLTLHGI
jgi:hypothetical protein